MTGLSKTLLLTLSTAALVLGQAPIWGQCGGQGWSGPTVCAAGSTCIYYNAWHSNCIPDDWNPGPPLSPKTSTTALPSTTASPDDGQTEKTPFLAIRADESPLWGQCGGQGWSGPTTCAAGSTCVYSNDWYSQCLPGNGNGNPPPSSTTNAPPPSTTTNPGNGQPAQSVEALYEVDNSLRGHTIYRPRNMNAFARMPVVVWGNGACSADGLSHVNFNLEIASWGVIVIAQGEPRQGGSTNSGMMKQAIDWAQSNSGKGMYANMDASRLAAAGMSCGGTEAYAMVPDSRVKAYGIFNSGNLDAGGTSRVMPQINVPIFFFLGGPSDIAYGNGMRDYAAVKSGVPSWVGNLNVGHGGTYGDPKGGKFGTAAQHYFRWVLRGDRSASSYFTGNGAQADGWQVQSKALSNLNPGQAW